MSDTDASVGGSAMLELKMKGYPRPQMKWTKDGQAITAGDRFKFIYPDQESAALIINKVNIRCRDYKKHKQFQLDNF